MQLGEESGRESAARITGEAAGDPHRRAQGHAPLYQCTMTLYLLYMLFN